MASSSLIRKILVGPPKLSADQMKAALSKSRYNRIIAGAGAGKTETLTRRIVYLLSVKVVKPESIVAFTFTEKAAQSMKSRIYQRVGQICGQAATAHLGEMYVGTIHAYAKRILEDYFGYGNYTVLDDNQEVAFLLRHGWSLGVNNYGGSYAECCRTFLKTVNMVWDELLDEKQLEKSVPDFYRRMKHFEEILKEHKLLTFGRMIYEAVLNLRSNPEKLAHVRHLVVDEYQDINKAQAELIRLIGRNGSIFVVGDPRQSIYQWRGSDERFFDEFSNMFSGTSEVAIRENRRSGRKIVQNANKFASAFSRRQYEEMDPTRPVDGFVGVSSHETTEAEARWIADQIETLMENNKDLKLSDFGILTRSVSTSATPLIGEFKKRGITYIVGGKVGLFKRDEAQALGRIFSWFWEDGFWVPGVWNWNERISGDALLNTAIASWDAAHTHGHPGDAQDRLRKIKADLNSHKPSYSNFTKIYYDVLNALGFAKLNYRNRNDAAIMANLGRFNNLLTDYETANRIGGRTPNWKTDLKGLCWFMATYGLQAYEEQPSDDIRGVDAVQLMTVHQAKGLEWPVVFLFATVDSRFPASRIGQKQSWCDVPRDMFDVERYEGDLEDERRLFYVAVTRAKDMLIISHFRRILRASKRSRFIDDMEPNAITNLTDDEPVPDLDINPRMPSEEIETFSTGEIVTYGVCPHMYLLREIWGYQPQLDVAIGYGNALHFCLRRAGELIKEEGYGPVSAVETSADKDFHMPFVGGPVLEYFKNGAKNNLVKFVQKYGDDLKRIQEVEYRLEYPLRNATIMGKVDVILKDGGEMEVRDYKTSQEVRTFEEVSVQVRLYTAGLRSMGHPVTSGSVAYLEDPDVKMVDVQESKLTEEKKSAEETVTNIMGRKFDPNPGGSCSRCDQRPICRWRE